MAVEMRDERVLSPQLDLPRVERRVSLQPRARRGDALILGTVALWVATAAVILVIS